MASKAEQIIDRFTKDPATKKEILTLVAEVKSGKHPHDIDKAIARFTTDPAIVTKIKTIISQIKAGHGMHTIAAKHHPDPSKAQKAGDAMIAHRAVVHHIVKQH